MRKRVSSSLSFSTTPVYSSSFIGSIVGPTKPCRRNSMALSEMRSRTVVQKGWAKASTGSVSLPCCTQKPAQLMTGGAAEGAAGGVWSGGGARPDGLDHVALRVAQERGNVVHVFRRVQLDDAVAFGVVHVHDEEAEALRHLGRKDEPGRVHHVAEGEVERQVEGAGVGLVGGEEKEGLVGALIELDLGDLRAHAAHVAAESVFQEVLPGAVEALELGLFGPGHEGVPGELVDLRVAHAGGGGHGDSDVAAGVADEMVNQQPGALLGGVLGDRFDQLARGPHVPADR